MKLAHQRRLAELLYGWGWVELERCEEDQPQRKLKVKKPC